MCAELNVNDELNRLLGIMDAAGIGTWDYDIPTQRITWCGKTRSLMGLGPEARTCSEALLAELLVDDIERLRAEIRQSARATGHFTVECRVRWPDQSVHWLMVQGGVFRDEQGRANTAAGIVMDVTDRKRLEEQQVLMRREAEHQRELLRRLIQHAPIGIAVLDAASATYLLANPKYEANPRPPNAPSGESFVGHHLGEFAPPELARFMRGLLRQVKQIRQPLSVRRFEANLGPGREHTWWDNDIVPLLDSRGNVESVLAITKEVTQEVLDRKRIEELASQMQHSRDKLQAIINSMNEGLVVIEPDGRIISANPAAMRLHGVMDLREVPNNVDEFTRVFELYKADGTVLEHHEWPLFQALRGGTVVDMEIHGLRKDTRQTWVASYSATPVRDSEGNIILAIIAIHDLTAINDAQERFRQLMADLERSNKDLEQFAYIASHDLQEPLRMVSGFLNLLAEREGPALDRESQEMLNFAVDGANRMSQLLKGLLQYSRVGTHGKKMEPVAVANVIAEAAANLKMAQEETSARLVVGDMPTLPADRTQLTQLFQNLLGNALKFRRQDVQPVIEIGSQKREQQWLFWVKDNGIGIRHDQAPRVFEIFQRLHARGKYPGIGVGLAVCRKIVERHGGRIWVESTPGEGSTFFFTLPVPA